MTSDLADTAFHQPTAATVRPATDADGEKIRAVVFGVLAEYGLAADPASYDADLFHIEAIYTERGGWFEVAEMEDGRIVGTWGLVPKGEGVGELRKMYLLPEMRGRGLGTLLLERALARARMLGYRRVELDTSSRLEAAARMYTKYGFTPIPPPVGVERCDAAYGLDLAAPSEETAGGGFGDRP